MQLEEKDTHKRCSLLSLTRLGDCVVVVVVVVVADLMGQQTVRYFLSQSVGNFLNL